VGFFAVAKVCKRCFWFASFTRLLVLLVARRQGLLGVACAVGSRVVGRGIALLSLATVYSSV